MGVGKDMKKLGPSIHCEWEREIVESYFPLNALKMFLHLLLTFIFTNGKSAIHLIILPAQITGLYF